MQTYAILKVSQNNTTTKGGAAAVTTERASNEVKKSMAYDLIQIIDDNPEKNSYTPEEIKKLIKDYIAATTAK